MFGFLPGLMFDVTNPAVQGISYIASATGLGN